jgi:hypothetical protein
MLSSRRIISSSRRVLFSCLACSVKNLAKRLLRLQIMLLLFRISVAVPARRRAFLCSHLSDCMTAW